MLMIREGVTQGYSLSVVVYVITPIPLGQDLWAAGTGLISPFYVNDAAFDRLARRSAQLLNLLMERGED